MTTSTLQRSNLLRDFYELTKPKVVMLIVFTAVVGMVLAVPAAESDACLARLEALGETAWTIGEIVERQGDSAVEYV